MKRDIDLCRAILLALEAADSASPHHLQVEGFSREQIAYHLELLSDAGLVLVNPGRASCAVQIATCRMTWSGHEFLDASREFARWQRAKAIVETAGGVSFDILKAVLVDLVKRQLGIS